jgi:hypothetical protein
MNCRRVRRTLLQRIAAFFQYKHTACSGICVVKAIAAIEKEIILKA